MQVKMQINLLRIFLISKPNFTSCYWGSGSAIWKGVLDKLIKRFPRNWNKLVKREVLFCVKNANHIVLNKMERYYIKKEKSHYSYGLGGCNFLWGELHGDDWVNAMKLPEIRAKVSMKNKISLKGKLAGEKHWNYGNHRPLEVRKKISETRIKRKIKMPLKTKQALSIYIHLPKSEEHKKKIGDAQRGEKSVHYGKHLSEEHKKKMSIALRKRFREYGSPNAGKRWITNGVENKWLNKNEEMPYGWYYGRTI